MPPINKKVIPKLVLYIEYLSRDPQTIPKHDWRTWGEINKVNLNGMY